jgi:quercetin dioxygenase-like cupin family protein
MNLATMLSVAFCTALLTVPVPVMAQQGIARTSLGTTDFPTGYQTVTEIVQIAAATCADRHSHPGFESGYVIEGDLLLKIAGKPDQTFKPGDAVQIPAGVAHLPCSTNGVKIFSIHVVEKGKPFASLEP